MDTRTGQLYPSLAEALKAGIPVNRRERAENGTDDMINPLNDDAKAALALVPHAKEIADFVRAKIPDGLHWGVLILVPGKPEGRVVAVTSDRQQVAIGAAQWVLDVLRDGSS